MAKISRPALPETVTSEAISIGWLMKNCSGRIWGQLFAVCVVIFGLGVGFEQFRSRLFAQEPKAQFVSMGFATLDVRRTENETAIDPKVLRLTLSRDAQQVQAIEASEGAAYRFCSLPDGKYWADLYIERTLAQRQSIEVINGREDRKRVEIPHQAIVVVEVTGTNGRPAAGAVVRVLHGTDQLREETIESNDTTTRDNRRKLAGTTGPLYVQPPFDSSEHTVRVSWKGRELSSKTVRLNSGENSPIQFKVSLPAK